MRSWRVLLETRSSLRLLLELFDDSDEAGSAVSVIPVVVDDYTSQGELIRATVRSFGASLVVASSGADGVRGALDNAIRARVEALLRVPRAGGNSSGIVLREDDGIVHATVDGVSDFTSTSQREITGLAATLFSEEHRVTDTAFIVYNEDVLDDEWADAVWRLFRDVDGTQFLGLRRIILLIERSAGDILDHHLDDEPSVRFLARSSVLIERKSRRVNVAHVRHIAQRASGDGLVLFLGAGFSRSSGLPLGDILRDEALADFLGMPGAGIAELAPVFHEYVRANERLLEAEAEMPLSEFCRRMTLERVLREEIWRSGENLSPTLSRFERTNADALRLRGLAVPRLHEVMTVIPGLVIVTVNFDTLIESDGANVRKIVSGQDFEKSLGYLKDYSNGPSLPVPLLKLHGSIEQRRTIVATVDQTAQGLSTAKELCLQAILNEGNRIPWVYVGYSMRDPDTWSILQSRALADRVDEYWVSPLADPNAREWCTKHRQFGESSQTFWQRCITLTADKFLEELLLAWSAQND